MKRHDHQAMLRLYEQWQQSGDSKTHFALSHGLRPTTFYYWTRKFEQAETGPTSGFQPISILESSAKSEGQLMAAIQYPSGTRLELYSSFPCLSSSYIELLKTLID